MNSNKLRNKKSSALESLFDEAENFDEQTSNDIPEKVEEVEIIPKKRGRPVTKQQGRQQIPIYIPDPVYYHLLDCVMLGKRSNRSYSMNELMLEAIEELLKKQGAGTIQDIIENAK